MKICISEMTTMPADLATEMAAFSKAGWKAIELHTSKLETYLEGHTLEELRQKLDDHGLTVAALIGSAPSGTGLLLTSGDDRNRYFKTLSHQLELCRAIGVPLLGIGSDPVREVRGEWHAGALENLASAGDLASHYGVMLGIEFVNLAPPVGPFVLDSLTKARALVEQVAHPKVGTILDLFHFYRSAGQVSEIAQIQPGQLLHVHFCDVMDLPRQELDDKHRVLPGDGLLPLEETAEALLASGYDGYLSLELLNEDLWRRPVSDVAVQGWASMQRFAAM